MATRLTNATVVADGVPVQIHQNEPHDRHFSEADPRDVTAEDIAWAREALATNEHLPSDYAEQASRLPKAERSADQVLDQIQSGLDEALVDGLVDLGIQEGGIDRDMAVGLGSERYQDERYERPTIPPAARESPPAPGSESAIRQELERRFVGRPVVSRGEFRREVEAVLREIVPVAFDVSQVSVIVDREQGALNIDFGRQAWNRTR